MGRGGKGRREGREAGEEREGRGGDRRVGEGEEGEGAALGELRHCCWGDRRFWTDLAGGILL